MSVFVRTISPEKKKTLYETKKISCFHGNMVLVKLQVAYHMSVLGLTFSQARGPVQDTTG